MVIEISGWNEGAMEGNWLRQPRGRCRSGSAKLSGNHLAELSTPVPANKKTRVATV
jgi:hypothetical protein